MSHTWLFIHCPTIPLSLPRSRNWVCPRCEKSNLECLPDPTPGGSNTETLAPDPLETTPEAEVTEVGKDEDPDTTAPDPSLSPSPQDPPEESPVATPIPQTVVSARSSVGNPRPPLLLDTAICVLLVLAFALLFRRFT